MPTRPSDVRALLKAVSGRNHVLVLTHNDPDPDALASAFGLGTLLRHLGHRATLAYGGMLGRSENRAMVRVLRLRFRTIEQLDLTAFDGVALVDTQVGAGNHALPPGFVPQIVLDHHSRLRSGTAVYQDIRPSYGACSTLVGEYLQVAGVPWNERLATALFYGIKTDTLGLARGAHEADAALYLALHQFVNQTWLGKIEQAPLTWSYFQVLQRALARAQVYGSVLFTRVDIVHRPDIIAEMADLLLRAEGVEWSVVLGRFREYLIVSLRTHAESPSAGTIVREVIGARGSAGGHGHMAAGRLPLGGRNPEAECDRIEKRLRALLGVSHHRPRPLVPSVET